MSGCILERLREQEKVSVKAERPVITPEPFSRKWSWEDWIDQFETIPLINGWNDEQELILLKVRLT